MAGIELSDGALQVEIQKRDGATVVSEIDIILLQLACEEVEEVHKLPLDANGNMRPTAQFLKDLSDKLSALGVLGCTPSVAVGLWSAASKGITELKKNTDETQSLLSGTGSILSEPTLPENSKPDCGCH